MTAPLNCHIALWVGTPQSKLQFGKFGSHRHSTSRDIMFLVCHVTLKVHVIHVLYDVMVWSPSR